MSYHLERCLTTESTAKRIYVHVLVAVKLVLRVWEGRSVVTDHQTANLCSSCLVTCVVSKGFEHVGYAGHASVHVCRAVQDQSATESNAFFLPLRYRPHSATRGAHASSDQRRRRHACKELGLKLTRCLSFELFKAYGMLL